MSAPDYGNLIDAEVWAFIDKSNAAYPEDAVDASIDEQRAFYDACCAQFHAGYPAGVTATDREIAGVPVRDYTPANAKDHTTLIYIHGGGFVVGGLDSHDDICAEIADRCKLPLRAIDYRLCPENPYPADLADCLAVFDATDGPVVLIGDSAGGNLCAGLSHVRRADRILGQVLIYPGLGGDLTQGSYQTHAFAPLLTLADVEFYKGIRGPVVGDIGAYSPLKASDFTDLPQTVAIAAECDPLADDAHAYAAAITAAGGQAQSWTDAGLVHSWLRARHMSEKAGVAFDRVCSAIAGMAYKAEV